MAVGPVMMIALFFISRKSFKRVKKQEKASENSNIQLGGLQNDVIFEGFGRNRSMNCLIKANLF